MLCVCIRVCVYVGRCLCVFVCLHACVVRGCVCVWVGVCMILRYHIRQ